MAAERGNQYYKLALGALGRPTAIKTAEEFQEKFLDYVAWSEENPILSKRASRREGAVDANGDKKPAETRIESESKRRRDSKRDSKRTESQATQPLPGDILTECGI